MTTTSEMNISISLADAQNVLNEHHPGTSHSTVVQIKEIKNTGFSYTRNTRTYILDLSSSASSPSTHSSFITISLPQSESTSPHGPNTLPTVSRLLTQIQSQTSIPITPSTLSTSLDIIPYHYILTQPYPIVSSNIICLADARNANILSPAHSLLIDLHLGKFLAQLHVGVQNDWYGLPSASGSDPADPSYSWQETFTHMLEALLSQHDESPSTLSKDEIAELRTYLSRAIAFFLFDDVEVPSLIWFTGSASDVYITIPTETAPPNIAAILPTSHFLYADPLLESFFLPPASEALEEGYVGAGGERLVVFRRQKTKRTWYTVFLALVVLSERSAQGITGDTRVEEEREKANWAVDALKKSLADLRDAPCY